MKYATVASLVAAAGLLARCGAAWSDEPIPPAAPQADSAATTSDTESIVRDPEARLKVKLSLYAWLSSLRNEVTTQRSESTTDVAFSDLFNALDFANFAHLEVQKGNWGLFSELDFIKLSQDAEFRNPRGIPFKIGADLVLKQTMFELGAIRSFQWKRVGFDALLGARYFGVDSEVNVGPLDSDIAKDWVDPMIGARLRFKLSDRWNASLRGDVAGFGVGSELTTNAVAAVTYSISERYEVGFGYRYMDLKYEAKRLDLDMTTYGPIVGMSINF